MGLSLAKHTMVVAEAMDMEEDVVVDIMEEEITDMGEVPMVEEEVTHRWVEGPEAVVVVTTRPSGRTTIAAWA